MGRAADPYGVWTANIYIISYVLRFRAAFAPPSRAFARLRAPSSTTKDDEGAKYTGRPSVHRDRQERQRMTTPDGDAGQAR